MRPMPRTDGILARNSPSVTINGSMSTFPARPKKLLAAVQRLQRHGRNQVQVAVSENGGAPDSGDACRSLQWNDRDDLHVGPDQVCSSLLVSQWRSEPDRGK